MQRRASTPAPTRAGHGARLSRPRRAQSIANGMTTSRRGRRARRRWRAAAHRRAARKSRHSDTASSAMPSTRNGAARDATTAAGHRRSQASAQAGHLAPAPGERGVKLAPARLELLHEAPEAPRMVHVPRVGELVDQQVVHDRGRLEHQAGIEADRAVPRAAAPARALAPDLQARESQAGRQRQLASSQGPSAACASRIVNRCSACRRSAGRSRGTGQREPPALGTQPRRARRRRRSAARSPARRGEIDALRQRDRRRAVRRPVQIERALDPAAMARHELLHGARPRAARHDDLDEAAGQHAHREPPRALARAHAPGIVRRSRVVEQAELGGCVPHGHSAAASRAPSSMARRASSSAATFDPPIRCGRRPRGLEPRDQLALRFLAGADDDVIDRKERAFRRRARSRGRDRRCARRRRRPACARRGASARGDAPSRSSCRGRGRAASACAAAARSRAATSGSDCGHQAAARVERMSMPHSRMNAGMSRLVGRMRGIVTQELGDVESDAAGADDRDRRARPAGRAAARRRSSAPSGGRGPEWPARAAGRRSRARPRRTRRSSRSAASRRGRGGRPTPVSSSSRRK